MGKDEPCVYALSLYRNKSASGAKFHSVSLVWLAKAFTDFYKDGIDWLRTFSEEYRNRPMVGEVKDDGN